MRMWMNSKYIKDGDIYLVNKENEKYVSCAIKSGASEIITSLDKTFDIKTTKVSCIKRYLYENYIDKINKLKLIGITGTNGKTTTCYLIYQMLNMIGIKTAYIGTIGFYIDDKKLELDNTTPEMDLLYNLLDYCYDSNCEVVVMEVSSHALKQNRVYGLLYDAIGITNITLDHLDYHRSEEDYINSKMLLINKTKNKKICVLNKKLPNYKVFIKEKNNNYIIDKDIKVNKIKYNLNSTNFILNDDKKYNININLIGEFNIYNFIMAYKIIKELGYNYNKVLENSLLLKEPKGRLEKISYNNNVIFIDYAHTPDAFLNVLKTVNKIKNKGIITVFGCGGNRDKSKRPLMGKIASKYSNYVIITNDNPRYEDEKDIVNDIAYGIKSKFEIIYDRYDAIKKGISLLDEENILLILGKGHETYQIFGNEKKYFSDYETVLNIINSTLN